MFNIGVIGYAVCSIAFLFLTVLLLIGARNSWQGRVILAAAFITFCWAVFSGYQANLDYIGSVYLAVLELLRGAAWILFLVVLMRGANFLGKTKETLILCGVIAVVMLGLLCCYLIIQTAVGLESFYQLDFFDLTLAKLLVAIVSLIFIEQLYRNTRSENRWAVKFLFLGIGGIFIYDFYLYADALLFNEIEVDLWKARGYINALSVPFIAISVGRNKDWSVDLFISRELAFHSVAITGIGFYLLVMAAGGYYIRIYGGNWGGVTQVAFFFGAGLILFVLLFSGQMRARLRVFIGKHFHHYKYDYREEWLRVIRLLTLQNVKQDIRGNAIRLLADIVESQEAGLWVRDSAGEYVAASSWNLDEFEKFKESDSSSMIEFLSQWQWVIDIDEYASSSELYQDLKLPEWMESSSKLWLIIPLMLQARLYGFVVLGRPRAPIKIGWEERDLLLTVGRQVTSYLALVDMDEALAEARQFEAYNRMSAYVVHDLKNLVAQLSLVVKNASKHKGNPAFMDDAIETVENAVSKMSRLLAQLRKGQQQQVNLQRIDLTRLLQNVVVRCHKQFPHPIFISNNTPAYVLGDRDRLGAVLEHLIQNAQEATPDDGNITVQLSVAEDEVIIEIVDTGCGMDKKFIQERLFKPFDTTKGNAGMGIGVYESREFIRSLGGSIAVESEPGRGTKFTVMLRLDEQQTPESAESAQIGLSSIGSILKDF